MTKKVKTPAPSQALASSINTDHALTVIDPYQDIKTHGTKIKGNWQKAVSSIIETGQSLIDAKNALPRGRWSKLFDKEIGNLPFSQETAQRLIKIAEHKVLSNPAYRPLLPPYWRTLSILARATDEQLENWIADGTVHPELEQTDAIALVNPTVLPAPDKDVPNESPEAVQVQMELGTATAERQESIESVVQQLDHKADLQLVKTFDELVHDPDVDWIILIGFAGEAKIEGIIQTLGVLLEDSRRANAKIKATATMH